ncbi:MAG: DUF6438 domain-containing protein [Janthinobacterium lividum]
MASRLFALLGLLLVAVATCRAQAPATEIDRLTTAAQVQQFMRTMNTDYTDYRAFILTDSLDSECAAHLSCDPLRNQQSWLKADFDGNGRTDLVVIGYESAHKWGQLITCFLDSGKQVMHEEKLSGYNNYCAQLQICYLQRRPAIRYTHVVIPRERFEKNPKPVCQIDTLIFDKKHFVEYNHSPKDYAIKKVEFSTTGCYGICPVFNLQVNYDGAATYRAEEYSKKEGTFTGIIAPQALKELWASLNYLGFPTLRNNYAISVTDHPTCTLTITYGTEQVKIIRDYGEQGTFGLQQVYQLLCALRETQAWR